MKYVFWKYDTFPYCLWAVLDRVRKNGDFEPKGYKPFYFEKEYLICILPEKKADLLINKLTALKNARNSFLEFVNKEARDAIKEYGSNANI